MWRFLDSLNLKLYHHCTRTHIEQLAPWRPLLAYGPPWLWGSWSKLIQQQKKLFLLHGSPLRHIVTDHNTGMPSKRPRILSKFALRNLHVSMASFNPFLFDHRLVNQSIPLLSFARARDDGIQPIVPLTPPFVGSWALVEMLLNTTEQHSRSQLPPPQSLDWQQKLPLLRHLGRISLVALCLGHPEAIA